MSDEKRRRLDELFDEVLDASGQERDEILRRAGSEDPDLKSELEALLAAHERATGILDRPMDTPGKPGPSGGDITDPMEIPARIGIYRIVSELGRGGMGVVFLAERDDGQFWRRVAIKVISGGAQSVDQRARFEAERQILATLDHPNIARLYDGGVTEDGRPYLVMEYVHGLPIDEYCRTHDLSVGERVRLFCTVARAVHHAHRRLVVHRDLKPTNILVTNDGEAKLLDFGIAKILDPSMLGGAAPQTRTGLHLMTPEYAAPEQVMGEPITTATDVYGLGVVLFEMLTGRRPFRLTGRAPAEWAWIIVQEAPPMPSEVAEPTTEVAGPGSVPPGAQAMDGEGHGERALYVPVDVDTNRLAARESRQRLRRLLRGDLDRIVLKTLRKEPERRYGSAARIVEDLERHLEGRPVEARADSAGYRFRKYVSRHRVGVGAALIVALSLVGGTAAALTQASRATRQAELAARQRDLMFDMFRLSDPSESQGDTISARGILDRGAARIEEEFGEEPVIQAAMLAEVAGIYANLGIFGRAEELARRALELRIENLGGRDIEVSESYAQVGRLVAAQGDQEQAIEYLQLALDIRQEELSSPDSLLALTQSDLAWQLRASGKHAEAAALFEQALAVQQDLLGDEHPDAASTLFGLAVSHHDLGEFEQAEDVFARALARFDTATMRPHPLAAEALLNIGMIRRLRGQLYDAEPLAASAVAMREALYDPMHPDVIEALGEWGVALRDVGRYEDSERVLHDALDRANQSLGYDHQMTLTMRERWGTVLYHLGRYEEAAATVDSSIAVKQERLEPNDANYIMALSRAGDPYWMNNRLDLAQSRYLEALAGAGRSGIYSILVLDGLANIAVAGGDLEQADDLYEKSLGLAVEKLRPGHRYTQTVRVDRAHLRVLQGRGAEMIDTLENVLEIRGEVFREPHPAIGRALHPLGAAYLAAGDPARAERILLRALESYAAMPESHWRVGDVSSLLGAALVAQDRRADGIRLLREGHATVVAHVGADSWQARATAARLAASGG
jgi:serine/threonine protein kinase/tetratricopeptide (TPR) repeat protein